MEVGKSKGCKTVKNNIVVCLYVFFNEGKHVIIVFVVDE